MKLDHQDKSLSPDANKGFSAAAQAAYERQMLRVANRAVSPEEANEIGRAVALGLEAAAEMRFTSRQRKAAAATADEEASLAQAQAAYDAAAAERAAAARSGMRLEAELRAADNLFGHGNGLSIGERIRLQGLIAAAGQTVLQRGEEVQRADRHLRRVRAAIMAAQGARYRAFVAGGF